MDIHALTYVIQILENPKIDTLLYSAILSTMASPKKSPHLRSSFQSLLGIEDTSAPSKTCIYCKLEKPLTLYPKHSLYKDGYDTRCQDCIKIQSKLRNKLHKTAPTKPATCQCCGSPPLNNKFCLDHDHKTHMFRGWLCDRCNTGIGKLGDDLAGIMKAVEYLSQLEEPPVDDRIFPKLPFFRRREKKG